MKISKFGKYFVLIFYGVGVAITLWGMVNGSDEVAKQTSATYFYFLVAFGVGIILAIKLKLFKVT